MTKAEIVTEISRSTGIEKASVLAVVEGLMTAIKDSLATARMYISEASAASS